ncbi:RNA-binding protein [uncultured Hyphomicrobium sp.]|uniref:RNA-binding protein n=1 Tax=uncultured Hyphomicrobium sp. TaxID=194373 RepID=UPI0025D9EA2E|nr:RNA-binding protein [uncultured Hyphomicrobium sp.]
MAERRRQHDDAEPAVESDGGQRLCAATREALDPGDLIRFVADPSGSMVPDLARRLPGRGVWVKADKAVVAQAVRANVFSKSLKRPVKADSELPERIERLFEKRVLEALAIANKAGLVTTGFQQVAELVESGAAVALVQGGDAADGGREKLARKFAAVARANGREVAVVTSLSTEQLSLAMGRSNVVHAALIQGGAAQRFLKEAERFHRYRSGSAASGGAFNVPENAQDLEV